MTIDQKVKQINNLVFDLLLDTHIELRRRNKDFFFMMNENSDKLLRFKEPFKYKSIEKEKYIILSFWQNGTSNIEIYNLRIEIEINTSIKFIANISKLQENKNSFLECFDLSNSRITLTENLLEITYTLNHNGQITSHLIDFIENQKEKIDDWVSRISNSNLSLSEYYIQNSFFATKIRPEHFEEMLANVFKNLTEHTFNFFSNKKIGWSNRIGQSLIGFDIRNFKGIKKAIINNLPVDANWIIITGKNGFGKSSLLQAITIGIWGKKDGEINLISNEESPFILIDFHHHNENWRRFVSKYNEFESSFQNLVAYGSTRLLNQATVPTDKNRLRDGSVISIFDNRKDLLNIESELITSYKYNIKYFESLIDIFYRLIPNLHKISINESQIPYVEYIEKDDNGIKYKPVKLNELAAGFRNIISFVGDMILRLSVHHYLNNTTFENIEGIVIIDELDLHLHPIYQREFPKMLTSVFPRVQFIASTHSPIPLLGVPKETIILNVDRSEEGGIVVKRLDEDIDFQNLTPNEILTSPIFGFQELIPESHDTTKFIISEDTFQDRLTAQKINKDISNFLTPDKTQELLQLIKQK